MGNLQGFLSNKLKFLTISKLSASFANPNIQSFPGVHHWERATTPYCCHGVVKDRSILILNYGEFRTLQESHWSITNTDLTFNWRHHFTERLNEKQPEAAIFSLPMRAHVDMNWPFNRKRNLKIDRSVKMQRHRLRRCESCTLLVVGSCLFSAKNWYLEQLSARSA